MKTKNFNRLLMLVVALLTMGINNLWAEDAPFYTLTFNKMTTGDYYNSYTTAHSYQCVVGLIDVTWSVLGNQSVDDIGVRVGGKNTTATDRSIYSTSALLSSISQISIEHGGTKNGSNTEITIHSITVEGSTNSNFSGSKSKTISNPDVSTAGTINFTLDAGNWDANSYYRIKVNYSDRITSGSSANNSYIIIKTIKFYANAAPTEPVTVTFDAGTNGSCGTTSLTEASAGAGVTLPNVTANEGYRFIGWSTSSTPTSADAGVAGATYKPAEDKTVYAYYKTIHTAAFYVNGARVNGPTEYVNGENIVFPADPEAINGKQFIGWAEATIAGTTDVRPTMFANKTMGDENINFYAVFADVTGTTYPYSFTISYSDFNTTSYTANDGSHSVTATCTTDGSKKMTVNYTTTNVMQNNNSLIQFKKGDGAAVLYNTTDLGQITSISVSVLLDETDYTHKYYGTSAQPNNTTLGVNDGYLKITGDKDNLATATSITVNFNKGDITYTNYCTTVGTPVSVTWLVNGEEYTAGDPTTEVISGAKVSVLPTAPADNTLDCAEEFMGWSATPLGSRKGQGAPADLFETVEDSPVITEDVTFYAIFAKVKK